jgi:hypothetical protein
MLMAQATQRTTRPRGCAGEEVDDIVLHKATIGEVAPDTQEERIPWRSGNGDTLAPALVSDAHNPRNADAETLDIRQINSVHAIDQLTLRWVRDSASKTDPRLVVFPVEWSASAHRTETDVQVVDVAPGSQEWEDVKGRFDERNYSMIPPNRADNAFLKPQTIINIQRVQNRQLYAHYYLTKKAILL